MMIFSIVIYTLFGCMFIWFIISGIQKMKRIKASQSLSDFYTDEEEHDKAIKEAEEYEKGYFERLHQGEQSQQFLAVGSFAVCSFIRSLLMAQGIPTYTENEHINSIYSLNVLGGSSSFSIKVFILISDYDEAHKIVYDFIKSHQQKAEDAEPREQIAKTVAATGTFFLGIPQGSTEDAVHGITILPRIS